jgi:hypothetical protein
MANNHNVQHPDPDPPVPSLFLKRDATGKYYAYAMGATSSGSANLQAVYAQIFGSEDDANNAAAPAPGGGGAWVPATKIWTGGGGPGGGVQMYQFGLSDGQGTVPNAQNAAYNWLAVYAFFADDPMNARRSMSFPVQFYGSYS